MNKAQDFQKIVNQAMQKPGHGHMRPVIEKELLHYDILFALDQENLLDRLTFQGGTLLRLCYGAPRFSEDLDFSGGVNFASKQLKDIKSCIERYIGQRYDLEVNVKEPKELRTDPQYEGINIDKWQISVTTSPARKDLPKQRIKIEVANIPSYSREPQSLQASYDFLPDGYEDILVISESLDEIMVDKVISLVNTQRYIRHRDIWDLRWLKQRGTNINPNWLRDKFKDYSVQDPSEKITSMHNNLPDIINSKLFQDEISRFIPINVQERTLKKSKFRNFLSSEIQDILKSAQRILNNQ